MTTFGLRLERAVRKYRTPLIVGLDPQPALFPKGLVSSGDLLEQVAATRAFCQSVLQIVAPLVPAIKPQIAFFEALGSPGIALLEELMRAARALGLLVILDAKRNDIGSTATAYAEAYFGCRSPESAPLADAITVNPYLGQESWLPFLEVGRPHGCGVFVLAKTSNPGGGEFQDLICEGRPLHEHVAKAIQMSSQESRLSGESHFGDVGAVVGATYPRQLALLREIMPNCWLLIPGFGAQGGRAGETAAGMHADGTGAIVNSSRAILYAHRIAPYNQRYGASKWEAAVEAATLDSIAQLRSETPAGRL